MNIQIIAAGIVAALVFIGGTYWKGYVDGKAAEYERVLAEAAREAARQSEINRAAIEAANQRVQEIQTEKDRLERELTDVVLRAHEDPSGDTVCLPAGRVQDLNSIK